jgi:hypothetical protein
MTDTHTICCLTCHHWGRNDGYGQRVELPFDVGICQAVTSSADLNTVGAVIVSNDDPLGVSLYTLATFTCAKWEACP